MFNPPEYKPYVPAFTTPLWSVPTQTSEDQKIKIWNEAIQAAMLTLYEAGFSVEVVQPVKALLK
jgi:hypothetical protein